MKHFVFLLICLISIPNISSFSCIEDDEICRKNPEYHQILINLIDYLQTKGAIVNKIGVKYLTPSNRYVIATDSMKKGEVITSIPLQLFLSSENDQIKPMCKKYSLRSKPCLALFMLTEHDNPNSPFNLYFKFLPKDIDNMPIFYSQKKMEIIKNSIVSDNVVERLDRLKAEVAKIKSNGYEGEIKFEDYARYRSMISSRNFGVEIGSIEANAVVPVSDLFNFDPNKINVRWGFEDKVNAFVIRARRNIVKGEELFLQYGGKDNSYLLDVYGFTLDNNPSKMHLTMTHKKSKIFLKDPPRLTETIKPFRNEKLFEIKDELNALGLFEKQITDALAKFPTKLEDDEKKLRIAIENNDFDLTNIYRILIEEKRLYLDHLKLIKLSIEALRKYNDGKKTSLFDENSPKEFIEYIKSIFPSEQIITK